MSIEEDSLFLSPFGFLKSIVMSVKLWFILIAGLYITDIFIDLPAELQIPAESGMILKALFVIAAFLQLGITGSVLLHESLHKYVEYKARKDSNWKSAQGIIELGLKTALWSLILLLTLDNLGIDITALVTGLGIGGIAAALAINNILGDLFASLSIILDDPFEVGDFIIVDEHMGTVEKIGVKSTRIRSLTGEQIVFANSDLLGSRIRNYKRMRERRVVFSIGITYETDLEKVKSIPTWMEEIVRAADHARFDRCHFKDFGDFSLNFETVYYMLTPEYNIYMDVQQAINQELLAKFSTEGVEFAYPTQVEYQRAG